MAQSISIEDFMKADDAPVKPKADVRFGVDVSDVQIPLANYSLEQTKNMEAIRRKRSKEDKTGPLQDIGNQFNDAIQEQGGWGLSPETRKLLGGEGNIEALRPLTDILPNVADVAYRGMQGAQAGSHVALNVLDQIADTTGLADLLSVDGNKFHPGSAIGALSEAFPAGGMETGIVGKFGAPKNDPLPPAVREALNKQADELFAKGASMEDMQKWASDNGMDPFGPELAEAIKTRDVAPLPQGMTVQDGVKAIRANSDIQDEAAAFKGTPEPKATDLFPTEESRAADAEAWGEKLGAPKTKAEPEPVTPETPAELPTEATLSKKEAEAQFKQEAQTKPLTTKEFQSQLEKDASDFLNKKKAEEPVETAPTAEEFDAAEAAPPTPAEEVMTRLTTAINGAAKIEAKVQRKLYSQARRERLGKATALRKEIGGEEGLKASLGALKGELPKADFEGIRNQFSDEDVQTLFNHISDSDKLHGFEPINAQVGLRKILDGQLPTASEIKVMDKVFPADFLKATLQKRSIMSKLSEGGANALNLPRSVMSTFDLSAPFTQGAFLVGRKEFWNSFGTMFKSFASEKAYNGVMDSIKSSPNYPWMEEGKLALTDIHSSLNNKEEKFMSNWAEKIPVLGHGVKASERAYTSFLNKLRADTFNNLLEKYKKAGINPEDDPKFISDLGDFINNATGRGNLGERGNAAAPLLSGVLFSPRLMAARVNMLRPDVYIKMHPAVRKEAIKSLLSFGGITTAALVLAHAGGAEVETDPRSSDFAKAKIDNTRYNVLGGFGPYLTLASRLVTSEKKTIKGDIKPLDGKKFGSSTRLDVMEDFIRSKFSPIASFVADYADGKDIVGNEFDLKKEAGSRFVPMFIQDMTELMKEEGVVKGGVMSVPGLFGLNSQTYEVRPNKKEFMAAPAPSETPAPETPDEEPSDGEISMEEFMNAKDAP